MFATILTTTEQGRVCVTPRRVQSGDVHCTSGRRDPKVLPLVDLTSHHYIAVTARLAGL